MPDEFAEQLSDAILTAARDGVRRVAIQACRKIKDNQPITDDEVYSFVTLCAHKVGRKVDTWDCCRSADGWVLPDYAASIAGRLCVDAVDVEYVQTMPYFWGRRIDSALKRDQSEDTESTGETRHLDAMYQAVESELERYHSRSAVRDLHPLLMSEIDKSRQKHKSDCARIQEYRATAQEARTSKPSNDWPDNYQAVVGALASERVLQHLGMRRTGRRWVCPRCQKVENAGRGTIDANGPKWYCFSCKEGGIAPTLLQHAGYNYQDSISLCLGLV